MTVKTRYPQGTLYHSDYLTWAGKVVDWLETQIAQPEYPAHLAPGLAPLVDDLHNALLAWDDLNEDQKGRSTVFSDSAGEVAKKLQFLKDIFPTTISDPMAMAEFGLDRKIPADRDELYVMAQTCLGQWVETTGGGVPPEYLPLEGFFTGFTALFADFMTKRGDYYTKLNAAQQAQNNVLLTRAACHELERKIFNWYRAHHKNPKDEWWTATWWGASSGSSGGGGGEEEEPGEPEPEPGEPWPAKPQNFIGELHIEVPIITLKWDALEGAEKYNMKKYIGGLGEIAPPPPMEYWKTGWIPNDIGETDIVPGMRHFYWVCGVDPAGVDGDWAMVWVDFPI